MSNYFEKIPAKESIDDRKQEIVLHDVDGKILEDVVSFSYSGHVEMDDESVKKFMKVALELDFDLLQNKCDDYFHEQLSTDNCVNWFNFAGAHNLTDLRERSREIICRQFESIPIEEIQKFDEKTFRELIENDINTAAADVIFDRLIKWIECDNIERSKNVLDLLKSIQPKIRSAASPQQMSTGKKTEIIERSETPISSPVMAMAPEPYQDYESAAALLRTLAAI